MQNIIYLALAALISIATGFGLRSQINDYERVSAPLAALITPATPKNGTDCATSTARPCYEKQTGKKLMWLEANGGTNAFDACAKNAAEGRQGESIQRTLVCGQEKFQYCFEGKSQVFLRRFEGACKPSPTPTPTPTPTPVPTPTSSPTQTSAPVATPTPTPTPAPTVTYTITLLTPNGGETWVQGFQGSVFWNSSYADPVTLNLLKSGQPYRVLATNIQPSAFSGYTFQNLYPTARHAWVSIPADAPGGNDYTLEIVDATHPSQDVSNANFTIVPLASPITVRGRFIDRNTGLALANTFLGGYDQLGNYTSAYTDANGAFSLPTTTADIAGSGVKSLFGTWPACYMSQGAGLYNFTDAIYATFDEFDLVHSGTVIPVYSTDVNLGDIKFWPAVTFNLNSDIPVKFSIAFPEEGTGLGNSLYKTSHSLSNALPLNYNLRVQLTDQTGAVYNSPYLKLPMDYGCTPKTLNFSAGQFTWQ